MLDIREFGAKPDGKTLNTKAMQAAIDACSKAGGGRVVCGPGVYLTGSLMLRDNVDLHLSPGCEILGSRDISHYSEFVSQGFHHKLAPEGTAHFLIGASHAVNIAITGSGRINASGPEFFDQTELTPSGKFAKKPAKRPRLLMLHKCENVKIQDASFVDSPCWTFWLMMCRDMNIHGIRIIGDQRMINNDGIDIDACENVMISDCRIKTDDDCLVLRAIQHMYDEPAICQNVTITNCTLESTCQCIRVSCPSDNIVRDCLFSNITVKSRNNGVNFDFPNRYLKKGSTITPEVSNIIFSSMVMECQGHPIRIEVEDGVKLGRVAGISFANVRARGGRACVIKGNSESIIEDITFDGVQMRISGDQALTYAECRGLRMNDVEFSANP